MNVSAITQRCHLSSINHAAGTLEPTRDSDPLPIPRDLGAVVLGGVGGAVFHCRARLAGAIAMTVACRNAGGELHKSGFLGGQGFAAPLGRAERANPVRFPGVNLDSSASVILPLRLAFAGPNP
jgi:hypothetical protein